MPSTRHDGTAVGLRVGTRLRRVGGASLVVPLYVVALGGDARVLGLLAAVAAFVGVPGAIVVGRRADRSGKRRTVVLAALAVVAVTLAVIPLARRPGLVVAANGVVWLAFASATPAVTLLAVADAPADEWSRRIGDLNRYQGVGWAVGLTVGTVWTAVAARFYGTGSSGGGSLTGLFVALAALAGASVLVGARTFPADHASAPADAAAVPDDRRLQRAVRRADRFSVRSVTFPFTPGRAAYGRLHPRRLVARFPPTLASYFGAVVLFSAGFAAFFAPLPAFLAAVGVGSDGTFGLYLVSSVGSAVAFRRAGELAGQYDVAVLQSLALAGRGLSLPLVVLLGTLLGVSTVGVVFVTLLFAILGLTWAVIAVTAGTLVTRLAPAGIRGEALGAHAALTALAGGVGSVLGGWLAASSYLLGFSVAGGLAVSGAGVVLVLRRRTAPEHGTAPPEAIDDARS